jgi:hypothetical protein
MQYINPCSCPLSYSMFGKGEEGMEVLLFLYLAPLSFKSLSNPPPLFLDTKINKPPPF